MALVKSLGRSLLSPLEGALRGGLPWEDGGGGAPPGISLASGGTFTRSTEASYYIGAPVPGDGNGDIATPFLAWAAVNERRIDNRGDALGTAYLTEGSRTNLLLHSSDFAQAAWTSSGVAISFVTALNPDGTTTVRVLEYDLATDEISQPFGATPANGARAHLSIWLWSSDPQELRLFLRGKDGVEGAAVVCSITSTPQRFHLDQLVGTGASVPVFILRGNAAAATAYVYAWNAQVECSAATVLAPSSDIRTTTATVTRGADLLSYSTAQYPAVFANGFAVEYAVNALPADAPSQFIIGGMDSGSINDGLLLSYNIAGSPRLFVDAASKFTGVITWASSTQKMRAEVRPAAGTITVSGATSGNSAHSVGAYAVPCNAAMTIGTRSDGTVSFFGRIVTRIGAI